MIRKYCMSCGKQGVQMGKSSCDFCGQPTKQTSSIAKKTTTPTPVKQKQQPKVVETFVPKAYDENGEYDPESADDVQYFNIEELGIDGLQVEVRAVNENMGNITSMNPQAVNEYKKALKSFQNKNK